MLRLTTTPERGDLVVRLPAAHSARVNDDAAHAMRAAAEQALAEQALAEQELDDVIAGSFPASDPPSWNPGVARPRPVGDVDGTVTDDEVIRQVLQGNTPMFELLMRRYNERVYRAARAIVRDEQEAEDVMQQAYVNAFTHLAQFHGTARFSTWLTRIAVNESLARVRRRGRYETFDDGVAAVERAVSVDPSDNPERHAFTGELRSLLESAVDTLPNGMREVFMLREVEGLSTAEAAEALGVSEDVVRTRLSRGRAALRHVLHERTGATAADAFRFHRPRCARISARVLAAIAGQPA